MKRKGKREFAEIGNGILDMKGIIQRGLELGTEYFTVEQDETDIPAMEACKISIQNIQTIVAELNR